ncbi:DgyrCDS6341 [Dimorphilus gyrociliatus]|uniref:DgyrCDS6341 n=1 Tax=Dimorphilus gyrociliatus TaxID=2664684 RepID=A0A7I8VNJ2_9ANNE|nr:DgyrCDS6341 [Dimorphilus gyrociliatus]
MIYADQSCVFCLWPWTLWSRFGVHPVKRFYRIFGEHIARFAGDADITFAQVKAKFGKALVIPVTNVSKMKVEYCSPQTTPDLPIRKAVRISLSFPILYAPIQIDLGIGSGLCSYSDGGLMAQYPIHIFDEEHDFTKSMRDLVKLRSGRKYTLESQNHTPNPSRHRMSSKEDGGDVERKQSITDNTTRLTPEASLNTKSLGLYVVCETAIEYQLWKKMFSCNVPRAPKAVPRTKLSKARVKFTKVSSKRFQKFRKRRELNKDGEVEAEEDKLKLFDFKAKKTGAHGDPVTSFPTFVMATLETMLVSQRSCHMQPFDHHRTIPINTGYIWTNDYDFEPEDRVFLLQEGYDSTVKYLENYMKRQSSSKENIDELADEEDDKTSSCSDDASDKIFKDDEVEDEIFNPVTAQYEHFEASGTLSHALASVGIRRRLSHDSSHSK